MYKVILIKCQPVKKQDYQVPKRFVILVCLGYVIVENVGFHKQVHPQQINLN